MWPHAFDRTLKPSYIPTSRGFAITLYACDVTGVPLNSVTSWSTWRWRTSWRSWRQRCSPCCSCSVSWTLSAGRPSSCWRWAWLSCRYSLSSHLISSHPSLNREGRWGTTDDFGTNFLHFPLLSTALRDLANSRPVHSLMLSSHLFLCLPCLLPRCNPPWLTWFKAPND